MMGRVLISAYIIGILLALAESASVRCRRASINQGDLMNPTAHTAMVIGQSHVITWNGRAYTLPDFRTGRCAYQLARDVRRQNFTLLQSRHMVELVTSSLAVRVRSDGRVVIDRAEEPSDLPVRSSTGEVGVARRGHHVDITTTLGVSLQYNTHTHNTLISLSPAYQNHVPGLLSADAAPRQSGFRTRHGHVTDDVQEFVGSYEVSGRPECHPGENHFEVQTSTKLCDNGLDGRCDELFRSHGSVLSACFEHLNPEPFRTMCRREARRCYQSVPMLLANICHMTHAYRDICRAQGTTLQPPSSCSRCGHHQIGDTWTRRTKAQVDVVVVTSGQPGSFRAQRLMHTLTAAFTTGGAPYNLRMGLVLSGGGVLFNKPHSQTFNGHLFSHHPHLEAITFFGTDPASGHHEKETLEAIRLAASYPFRPESIKLITVLTNTDTQNGDISSLVDQLTSRGLTVNVVSHYDQLQPQEVFGLMSTGELLTTKSQRAEHLPAIAAFPQTTLAQVALRRGGMLLDPLATWNRGRQLVERALRLQADHQMRHCNSCTCHTAIGHGHNDIKCRKVAC